MLFLFCFQANCPDQSEQLTPPESPGELPVTIEAIAENDFGVPETDFRFEILYDQSWLLDGIPHPPEIILFPKVKNPESRG